MVILWQEVIVLSEIKHKMRVKGKSHILLLFKPITCNLWILPSILKQTEDAFDSFPPMDIIRSCTYLPWEYGIVIEDKSLSNPFVNKLYLQVLR